MGDVLSSTTSNPSDLDHSLGIYLHSKRHNWGMAILVWERGDKRAYQFEDGSLRVFRSAFYRLFERVSITPEETVRVLKELNLRLQSTQADFDTKQNRTAPKASTLPTFKFEDLIEIFLEEYPGNFQDPKWLKEIRGEGAKTRIKRHRNAAILDAQDLLTEEKLDAKLAEDKHKDIWDDVIGVLSRTNLVNNAHMKPLKALGKGQIKEFSQALREFLYNDDYLVKRFKRYRESLGTSPSWQLITVIPALVQPHNHVCVLPTSFRRQAAVVHTTPCPRTPSANSYQDNLKMAQAVLVRLKAAGLKPQDLVDIHDFIHITLKPSTIKKIKS